MSIVNYILVVLVGFLAGVESILDEFEFHQPILTCSLMGLASGHLYEGVLLGGYLQMIALGWVNMGAVLSPDAALAAAVASVCMILGLNSALDIKTLIIISIAIAVPVSALGTTLTTVVRKMAVHVMHHMQQGADQGNIGMLKRWHLIGTALQGLRIALPTALLLLLPSSVICDLLNQIPVVIQEGMVIGGGMIAAVGLAMVINSMSSIELWPFFIIGFVLAQTELTLIGLGLIGLGLALIYLQLKNNKSNGNDDEDPLGDILNDY